MLKERKYPIELMQTWNTEREIKIAIRFTAREKNKRNAISPSGTQNLLTFKESDTEPAIPKFILLKKKKYKSMLHINSLKPTIPHISQLYMRQITLHSVC
jgi:hypothetical protein